MVVCPRSGASRFVYGVRGKIRTVNHAQLTQERERATLGRKFRFSFRARCYRDWLHSKSFTILLHFAEKFEGTGAEFSGDDFLGQVSASRKFCFLLLLTGGGFSSENGAFVTFFVASPNWRCSAHQREFLGLKLQNVGISH